MTGDQFGAGQGAYQGARTGPAAGAQQGDFRGYEYYQSQVDPEELFRKIFGDAFSRGGFGNHEWMNESSESQSGKQGITQVRGDAADHRCHCLHGFPFAVVPRSHLSRSRARLQQRCQRAHHGYVSDLQGHSMRGRQSTTEMPYLQWHRHGNHRDGPLLHACHVSNVSRST